jgi:septal ring-binding cell division protein DamX
MVFLNMLYTCSLARKLIYGFLKYVKESMAGHVQDSITIRVGSLWIDDPLGPLVNNNARSLHTTTTSPVVLTNEQEVNSKSEVGFIPVVSKASKRRARKAAAAAAAAKEKVTASKVHTNNVREVSSRPLAPRNFPKAFKCQDLET